MGIPLDLIAVAMWSTWCYVAMPYFLDVQYGVCPEWAGCDPNSSG